MYDQLKKKFGQNFLIDQNILKKINNLINQVDLNILEIGPGSGNLTNYILKSSPSNLTLIEIDNDLIENLKKKYNFLNNVKIIHGDFLKDDQILNNKYDLVVANLPYNVSSQILIKLTISKYRPSRMILMFQKEFADRLLERKLNSLNSIVNCFYKIEKKFLISNTSFYPPPKVKSAILEFSLLNNFLINENDIIKYIDFKRNIFNKKRKKIGSIIKNYKNFNISCELAELRAESISLRQFIEIYYKINP